MQAESIQENGAVIAQVFALDARGDSGNGDMDMASGTNDADIFNIVTSGRTSDQVHLYGRGGDDIFHLDMRVEGLSTIQHGHHLNLGSGHDEIRFEHVADLRGTIVGRIDDLISEDNIFVDGVRLDLHDPESLAGFSAKVVMYQGQQWLDLQNADGGRLFYALEAPRQINGVEEAHFLAWNHDIPDLPAVDYVHVQNTLPGDIVESYVPESQITAPADDEDASYALSGTANDDLIIARSGNDTINGGAGDDQIQASKGSDQVDAGEGNDMVEGGRGFDLLRGDVGDDSLSGGTDSDTLIGGAGHDWLIGGSENDSLDGGDGSDLLDGETGDDTLRGGAGRDFFFGGAGNDLLIGGDDDQMQGGAGDDRFDLDGDDIFVEGQDGRDSYTVAAGSHVEIYDFTAGEDVLDLAHLFEDEADLAAHLSVQDSEYDADWQDLVIDLPGDDEDASGQIILIGAGALVEDPSMLVSDWEGDVEEDDAGDDGDSGGFLGLMLGGLLLLAAMGGGVGGF